MSVDSAYIEDMSDYVFDTHFTQRQFDRWFTLATDTVTQEDPGFTPAQYDEAVAFLICHRIELKRNKGDVASESQGGDYQWSRNNALAAKGETQWMRSYNDLVARVTKAPKGASEVKTVQPTHGSLRSDSETNGAFKLDANLRPGVRFPDSTIRRYP